MSLLQITVKVSLLQIITVKRILSKTDFYLEIGIKIELLKVTHTSCLNPSGAVYFQIIPQVILVCISCVEPLMWKDQYR